MDKAASIELLNKAVADELQAIHQYLYWHFHLEDQGLMPLAQLFRRTAVEEMGHVAHLAERILFLKGDVDMAAAGPVERITDPQEILTKAAAMEDGSAADYNAFAAQCAEHKDSATKQIFEGLVADEERHFDAFDTQVEHVKRYGPSYLALQSFQADQQTSGGQA
ncbi:MAG: bacterioferritin [Planctomycetota bacterium]